MEIFCSTIIPTIGRASLTSSVECVLQQTLNEDDFEVIVVNDSGRALPELSWMQNPRVRVVNTNQTERSVARNAGAVIARGKFLHFLDDDDVILPGALESFRQLSQRTSAIWLYGNYRTVDNKGNLVEEIRPEIGGKVFALLISGEGIPLQTSLLRADAFRGVGGFDPDEAVLGVEDRDLGRRIALHGKLDHNPAFVAQIRIGEETSTTNWAALAERDRFGREKALRLKNALAGLRESIDSHYWQGRVSRAYFASTIWNLKRLDVITAASRALIGLAFAAPCVWSGEFWEGLGTKVT